MKRVLMVRHAVPFSGMEGLRFLRIAKALPACGYQPQALVCRSRVEEEARSRLDFPVAEADSMDLAGMYKRLRSLGKRGPVDQAGQGTPANPVASRNIALTSFINRWFMVPDKEVTWYRPAVRAGRAFHQEEPADLIFGSLLPRTTALVATRLARDLGIPCVLEYRDLWTGTMYSNQSQPTALHRRLHMSLERRCLRHATRVTALSTGIARYLDEHYHQVLAAPVQVNYNFYDPDEYPPRSPSADRFIVSYIGNLYGERRPDYFFRGMAQFIQRENVTPKEFGFRWIGASFGLGDTAELVRSLGIEDFIEPIGVCPHDEALRELANSHVAVLIQAPNDEVHIPGKLFEALGARVPLLALSDPCETADIVERTRAGIACRHDPAAVADALQTFWRMHRGGETWTFDDHAASTYSAERAVAGLSKLFDEAIEA